ncbi:thermonuclease family protein [Roseicyclus elongatus]|uniref:thermonuclease family protein n=1 Tax=Roseicyclus elongatus TaxID=159346 RepID=UPI0018DC0F68|nr:hypothetical protein [Roseibacterium elongatum]
MFRPLLLITLTFFAQAGDATAREISGTAYIRDADTIVVSGIPVRLNGIDAPENSNRYGREATRCIERLLRGKASSLTAIRWQPAA